jgi:hypothetical protein
MRKLVVTCDVCQHLVDDFNGGVTVAGGWGETVRADACSIKCVVLLLKGLAAEIEEKGEKIMADNAAFLKANPGATMIAPTSAPSVTVGSSHGGGVVVVPVSNGRAIQEPPAAPPVVVPPPAPSEPRPAGGCAACDAGVEYSGETAHRHTGEGKLCSEAANEGKFKPCTCPPENWKMDPPDNNPGQHEVACQKCGNCWSVNIGGSAEGGKRGKGRPRGAKNKRTLEAEAAAAAAAANGTANGTVAETPENKAQRDEALGRAPDTSTDELARLKASREGSNGTKAVSKENPAAARENLSQLVTELSKLGIALNLVTVTGWTSMQIDLARAWAMHPEHDKPEFLQAASEAAATLPAPPLAPPAPAPVEAAKSRFTF